MTVERTGGASEKASLLGKIASWLLVLPAALVGILLVELFCYLFVPSISNPRRELQWDERVIFFDGDGTIFANHGDIFTYLPHNTVRNVTAFLTNDGFDIEYDYKFNSNNLGLVQDNDIEPGPKSLLLLGDSFTEGQGDAPWFRRIAPQIKELGYQPINGGILATGFLQWLKLDQYLSGQGIQNSKLLIIFISDDYRRPLTTIAPPVLHCLSTLKGCRVQDSYFYRLPPAGELAAWVDQVRVARGWHMIQFKDQVAAWLPASYRVYRYLKQRLLVPALSNQEQQSHDAIAQLIALHGEQNVAFLHLPQKEEVLHGPNVVGLVARRAIADAGGRLFDGFELCGLTVADYYVHDDHPNPGGYRKIGACAGDVINAMLAKPTAGNR